MFRQVNDQIASLFPLYFNFKSYNTESDIIIKNALYFARCYLPRKFTEEWSAVFAIVREFSRKI